MKITFIGAGSHRYAPVARGLLARDDLTVHEIALYDLDKSRAQIMAEFIKQTPEYKKTPCIVSWDHNLEEALEGSDLVNVVISVNDPLTMRLMCQASARYGFMGNDAGPLTPAGSVRGVKVCSIIFNIVRKMEKLCPDAWLLDFSNPVSVVSGLVNHHSKIKAYGICAGATNHLWDISRLFGKDEMADDTGNDIHTAGVNHFSFIAKESIWKGRNLYDQLEELIAKGDWRPPFFETLASEHERKFLAEVLRLMLLEYKRSGYLLFSSEKDGLGALSVHGFTQPQARIVAERTYGDAVKLVEATRKDKQKADSLFADLVKRAENEIDWNNLGTQAGLRAFRKNSKDLIVLFARAKAGNNVKVVSSVPNNGAIKDVPDRCVVEFSQVFDNGHARPSAPHVLPVVWHSWISAFAAHQTLLADAIAYDCPETLYKALSCYPVNRDSSVFWAMWREVARIAIDSEEISSNLKKVVDFMPQAKSSISQVTV